MALSIDPRSDSSLDMAPDRGPDMRQPLPQRFVPPTLRELRGQAVHRLQVGLLGLCTMLLIVGLANIIMTRAKLADRQGAAPVALAPAAAAQKQADPLADIGVVPAADPSVAPPPTAKAP